MVWATRRWDIHQRCKAEGFRIPPEAVDKIVGPNPLLEEETCTQNS